MIANACALRMNDYRQRLAHRSEDWGFVISHRETQDGDPGNEREVNLSSADLFQPCLESTKPGALDDRLTKTHCRGRTCALAPGGSAVSADWIRWLRTESGVRWYDPALESRFGG